MVANLIVGYGEIGQAIAQLVQDYKYIDVSTSKSDYKDVEVMHICFPYSKSFVDDVKEYKRAYKPKHIVIYSTVPIGTTKQIPGAVHSPIEGRHPKLYDSISKMERWIGANSKAEARYFWDYFGGSSQDGGLELSVFSVDDSDHTEALKLMSTAEYGVNLVFADYKAKVAKRIGMNYELTKLWNEEYNCLYLELNMPKFQKYVLDAPNGHIGGHCVVPNAKLLNEQIPNELLEMIGDME